MMINEINLSRLSCIILSLFPALWGIFSLLNNIADFANTARHAVGPLLAMQDTYQVPALIWRALSGQWAGMVGYYHRVGIAGWDGCSGGCCADGETFEPHPYEMFAKDKAWAMLGALCAIVVWGLGFMVVAGDWFMAWKAKENPLAIQLGALVYMVPNTLVLIVLMQQRDKR